MNQDIEKEIQLNTKIYCRAYERLAKHVHSKSQTTSGIDWDGSFIQSLGYFLSS